MLTKIYNAAAYGCMAFIASEFAGNMIRPVVDTMFDPAFVANSFYPSMIGAPVVVTAAGAIALGMAAKRAFESASKKEKDSAVENKKPQMPDPHLAQNFSTRLGFFIQGLATVGHLHSGASAYTTVKTFSVLGIAAALGIAIDAGRGIYYNLKSDNTNNDQLRL